MKAPTWLRKISAFVTGKRFTVYNGATGGRLTNDWIASILSADQEIRGNLRLLRARARELVRNNDKTLNAAFNTKIEDAWVEWGKKGNCTADGKLSFRAVQNLVLKNI